MYDIVIKSHVVISGLFLSLAVVVLAWAIYGWLKNRPCHPVFRKLSNIFMIGLYLELLTGLALYFFLQPEQSEHLPSLEEAIRQNELRFWAIEHVTLMVFALILAQIGRLLIARTQSDKKRYRNASLYYGGAFLLIVASAAMAIFR